MGMVRTCATGALAIGVFSFLLAGCASPASDPAPDASPEGDSWQPLACDPSNATAIGGNAPAIPGLVGTDRAVAARVARAFGDELASATPVDSTEDFARWATSTGYVQVSHHEGGALWEATTWRGDHPSEERLLAGLRALGAPEGSLQPNEHSEGMVQQLWDGKALSGASGWFAKGKGDPAPMGWYGSFAVRGFVVPPGALDTLPDEDLAQTAREYDRCAMDADGLTEAAGYTHTGMQLGGLAVQHDSIVRQVYIQYTEPQESHCGFSRGVAVDVVTGAVHGRVLVYCD